MRALLSLLLGVGLLLAGCSKPAETSATAEPPPPIPVDTTAAAAAPQPAAPTADLQVGPTLENLQAAYNGESNASARYEAFAKKADEEGYKQVAVLFRAASKAESIHAAEHAGVIQKLGGKPTKDVKAPDVKTTADNLKAAVEGESYERDTMYPGFIAKAKAEGQEDAVRTFEWAVKAEAEHAKLYQAAADDLASQKEAKASVWVCSVCGFTTLDTKLAECPTCTTPREKWIEFK